MEGEYEGSIFEIALFMVHFRDKAEKKFFKLCLITFMKNTQLAVPCLQNPKWPTWSGKGFTPRFLDTPVNFP